MAISKNPTRKELLKQPDEFITTFGKLVRFARAYQHQITAALGLVIVIVLALAGWRYWLQKTETKALGLLDQAIGTYQSQIKAKGPVEARQAVEKQFDTLIQDYTATAGGKLARLVYADVCYAAGDAVRAAELYGQALAGFRNQPFFENLLRAGMGHARFKQTDWGSATALFEKALATPAFADEALFHLGLIYGLQGDNEKSRGCFNRLITEHPTSIYAPIAREKAAQG